MRSSTSAAFSASSTSSRADWSRAIVCLCPSARTIGVVSLTFTRWPLDVITHANEELDLHHQRGRHLHEALYTPRDLDRWRPDQTTRSSDQSTDSSVESASSPQKIRETLESDHRRSSPSNPVTAGHRACSRSSRWSRVRLFGPPEAGAQVRILPGALGKRPVRSGDDPL